jgi:membrane protein implicated in regulation of membrane protease activity
MVDLVIGGNAVTAFIVIGAVGLAIVIITLLLGEIFDGLLGAFDVDVGGGIFSAPVIGSFLAAFGFGAALIMFAGGVGATAGALGGLASGLVVGGFALMMMRSLMNMPTDATVTTRGLEGARGTVITPIPANGYGEVTIRHHGEQRKYNAQAIEDLPSGTPVEVTGVLSASAVTVARADDARTGPSPQPPPTDPSGPPPTDPSGPPPTDASELPPDHTSQPPSDHRSED